MLAIAMNANKSRRLARDYLAAVDNVFLALDRAKARRAALRRELDSRDKITVNQHQRKRPAS